MPKIVRKRPEGIPFYGPKSVCTCGHLGDGIVSQHKDTLAPGHGECFVKDCSCIQFTWAGWTDYYKQFAGLK